MKSKVFVSSACGVEDSASQAIGVLYDEISFSNVEIYRDFTEIDFESFIDRIKLDKDAKPQISFVRKKQLSLYFPKL